MLADDVTFEMLELIRLADPDRLTVAALDEWKRHLEARGYLQDTNRSNDAA